ncbi:DUF1360 domain-containing protein [Actinacidiphila sp. bgisy167]|uniref:DUF1360 domain-containing protein n=1 Tax=Actinacidiphila sp. bgisy167 TaxID=3413797 RepID=UPI003D7619CC
MPVREEVTTAATETAQEYAGGADRPLGAFGGLMAGYGGAVCAIAGAARLTGRKVAEPTPWDVALCAGATHRLSRLVTKDAVTSPLRAPFSRFKGTTGPAELEEEVRGSGARKAVGELLTCPFCTSLWFATGFAAGLVFAPAATRLAAGTLTALTVSDLLHFARSRAQRAAGE